MSYKEDFINKVKPYANYAGSKLNVDPNFIVSQWAHETGYGTNTGTKNNNLAGIMAYAGSPYGVNGEKFDTLGDFTTKYISVLSSDRYKGISSTTNVTDFAKVLKNGGYAEDRNYPYYSTWGEAYNLSKNSNVTSTSYDYMTEDGTVIKDEKIINAIDEVKTGTGESIFGNPLNSIFDFLKVGFANVVLVILMILFVYVSLIQGGSVDKVGKSIVKKVV